MRSAQGDIGAQSAVHFVETGTEKGEGRKRECSAKDRKGERDRGRNERVFEKERKRVRVGGGHLFWQVWCLFAELL